MSCAKKKIMFVCMPITDLIEDKAQEYLFNTRAIVNVPYGLLSICTYVKNYAHNDVEVKILDINDHLVTQYQLGNLIGNAQAYFEDFVASETSNFAPDIIGISVMFNVGYQFLDRLAARIKKVLPNSILVVGGNLATVCYEEVASKVDIDAVVFGEGEIPILQLIDSQNHMLHIASSNAFVTKMSLERGTKPVNHLVRNLDTIPKIDFSYVNLRNFNLPKQKGNVYKKDFNENMVSRIIYLSRGCPYNCNFCAGFNVHGKAVRFLSIQRVIDDVRYMVNNDHLTELFVCDDSFLIDKARAKSILKEFVTMKIHVSFPAILMRNIDDEIAELLAALGNTFQYTSLESGSDYVLKYIIQKPISKIEAQKAVDSLRKQKISVLTNIVVGSPEETDEHRKETLDTLYKIGFSWVFIMIALPIQGSRLYEQCKENGYLVNENFFSPSLTRCNIRTPAYTPEHIEEQAYMMNLYINFIHNYNLRMGNYEECVNTFTNVIRAHPGHAFAHYCLAKAYEGQGESVLADENKKMYRDLVFSQPYWENWAKYFELD